MRKNIVIRIIPFVTTFLIMAAIFAFSAQNAEQSSQVSRGLTAKIVDILPMTKNLPSAGKGLQPLHQTSQTGRQLKNHRFCGGLF